MINAIKSSVRQDPNSGAPNAIFDVRFEFTNEDVTMIRETAKPEENELDVLKRLLFRDIFNIHSTDFVPNEKKEN